MLRARGQRVRRFGAIALGLVLLGGAAGPASIARGALGAALVAGPLLLAVAPVRADEPEPAPPYPPPRPPRHAPPPPRVYLPAPPPPPPPPPPLSPVLRVVYAPFYAAGLVLRYGLYYGLVAPLEVFTRAVTYGAPGGVEPPPAPQAAPGEDEDS